MKPTELNPDWSRESTSTGYVVVYCPDHPNAWSTGYVYKHRLLMELHLDRFLDPKTEHVHHKNEDRHDNALSNLVVESPVEHAREHGLRQGKPLTTLTCASCSTAFQWPTSQIHKGYKRTFCSQPCYHDSLRN